MPPGPKTPQGLCSTFRRSLSVPAKVPGLPLRQHRPLQAAPAPAAHRAPVAEPPTAQPGLTPQGRCPQHPVSRLVRRSRHAPSAPGDHAARPASALAATTHLGCFPTPAPRRARACSHRSSHPSHLRQSPAHSAHPGKAGWLALRLSECLRDSAPGSEARAPAALRTGARTAQTAGWARRPRAAPSPVSLGWLRSAHSGTDRSYSALQT